MKCEKCNNEVNLGTQEGKEWLCGICGHTTILKKIKEDFKLPICGLCGKAINYTDKIEHGHGICNLAKVDLNRELRISRTDDEAGKGIFITKDSGKREVRKFDTGSIRDNEEGKEDYTETISWTAMKRYAEYMTSKKGVYGSGNFKKGIPIESFERSFFRHASKYMINKYEGGDLEKDQDHLCAILFNIFGIIHEEERAKLNANTM